MKKVFIAVVLFVLQTSGADRKSLVVFPLVNESGSRFHDWIGACLPEFLARKVRQLDQLQIWDPVFIFQTDTAGWRMGSDSLLAAHQARWRWDAAIGGAYSVTGERMRLDLRIVVVGEQSVPIRMELVLEGAVAEHDAVCADLLFKAASLLRADVTKSDSARVLQRLRVSDDAYRTYVAGYGFEMRGDNSAALTALSRAVEMNSQFAVAMCRLGKLYGTGGRYQEARDLLERAVAVSSKDPFVAAEFADILVESNVPDVAGKFIEGNREVLSRCAPGLEATGKYYISLGEYQRAVSVLTRAVASGASDLDPQFALGTAYLASGEYRLASEVFNTLLRFRPDYMRYYSSLGASYRRAGQLMESSMVLEAALRMAPENTMILVDLAHTYLLLRWYDKAEQLLLRARDLDPDMGDIYINLGVVCWHQGRQSEAKAIFAEAARRASVRQPALNNTGNLLFLSGDASRAVKAYRKADKAGKKNPTVLYNLATAYLSSGNLRKASYYFDEVLRLAPRRMDVLVTQAGIAQKLKRKAAAESYYRTILEITPYHEDAIMLLVGLLMQQKRYEEAVKPVETYLNHIPNNRDFLVLLADIYRQMGWYEVAIMKYQFIIRDYPSDPAGYLGTGKSMYEMIRRKGATNYDEAIHALKLAAERTKGDPEPDMMIGDIYGEYRNYRELALDHWNRALSVAKDESVKRQLRKRIDSVK